MITFTRQPDGTFLREGELAKGTRQVSISRDGHPGLNKEYKPQEPAPFESSNINAMRYDPEKQEAYIKFQGKFPSQNGPVYKYSGVPPYIFDVIQRGSVAPKTSGKNAWHRWERGVTPSHGASVSALLKAGGFNYQRLTA